MTCDEIENIDNTNYIVSTIMNIDRMQKKAVINEDTTCITCNHSLGLQQYNTLPIVLYLRNSLAFEPAVGITGSNSRYLRIESVRQERFATFSILELEASSGEYTNTGFTCLVDLACVCALSCLAPVNVAITCNIC